MEEKPLPLGCGTTRKSGGGGMAIKREDWADVLRPGAPMWGNSQDAEAGQRTLAFIMQTLDKKWDC